MTNITKNLNEWLLNNPLKGEFDVIYNDLFPFDDGDCLISRYEPGTANETQFIDGSSDGSVSIGYYMRSEDGERCRRIADIICDAVDGLSYEEDGTETRFEALTTPSFVSEDEKHQVVYTCTIQAFYNRKGEL